MEWPVSYRIAIFEKRWFSFCTPTGTDATGGFMLGLGLKGGRSVAAESSSCSQPIGQPLYGGGATGSCSNQESGSYSQLGAGQIAPGAHHMAEQLRQMAVDSETAPRHPPLGAYGFNYGGDVNPGEDVLMPPGQQNEPASLTGADEGLADSGSQQQQQAAVATSGGPQSHPPFGGALLGGAGPLLPPAGTVGYSAHPAAASEGCGAGSSGSSTGGAAASANFCGGAVGDSRPGKGQPSAAGAQSGAVAASGAVGCDSAGIMPPGAADSLAEKGCQSDY